MDNYERTIDLEHVFNYVKFNFKKILMITMVFAIVGAGIVTVKNVILPSEKLYYSTAKILFKYNSWSTSEKDYSLEDWKLNGTEEFKSDSNSAFFNNSRHVFSTDRIMIKLMEKYNIEQKLSKFKEHIIVENIYGTDFVRIIVTASSPEIAEDMRNTIIDEGLKSVENLYELKYEVMDEYTNTEKSFSKLKLDEKGEIQLSSNIMLNIKLVLMCLVLGFLSSIIYFAAKCMLNSKVDNVEQIEGELGVSVLQVVGKEMLNLDVAATKIINSEVKTILVSCIKKEEAIGKEIIQLARSLKTRGKRSLVVCAEADGCLNSLGVADLKGGMNTIEDIDIIETKVILVNDIVSKYKDEFDFILVESKCTEEKSDALLISKVVDYTLLVTECNIINADEFYREIQGFKKYSSGIDGIILKGVTQYSSSYKYIKE